MEGVVVIGDYLNLFNSTMNLTYDSVFLDNPPPGFGTDNPMRISAGSWRREVSE
jgi:hypothetical protein